MAGMIPPAVIPVKGDDSDWVTTVGNVKATLGDLAKAKANPRIGADASAFETDIGTVNAQLADLARKVTNARLGADAGPLLAELATIRETVKNMSPLDINFDANLAAVVSQLALFRQTLAGMQFDLMMTPEISSAALGAAVAKAAAGESLGTILGKAFMPKISWLGIGGAAGGVTVASHLAGLSIEHAAIATLDLGGSAMAALGGGLLKGLAGGAVAAVGIGTNMAGIGQAAGDIKMMYTDTNNLSRAIAVYGKNSLQAKVAQAQYNYDLQSFSSVAKGPVLNAMKALLNLKTAFDKATGPAEAKGANIITQGIKVAQQFVGVIGKFASINMSIIDKQLQPLFKFMSQGGKGFSVFVELEKIFTAHLPTGMQAFVQGFEALVKVIGIVAPKTGGFMTSLSNFFTKLNSELNNPKSKDSKAINSMLTSWNAWFAFIKQASTDIYRLFSNGKDQKTGLSVIQQLTGYLKEFGTWENSAKGTKDLTALFKASKSEIQNLISLLPPLAKALGGLFLALAPGMHTGMSIVIKGIADLFNGVGALAGKVAQWKVIGAAVKDLAVAAGVATGVGLLAAKLKVLGPVVDGIVALLAKTPLTKLPGIGSLLSKAGTSSNASFSASVNTFSAAVTRFSSSVLGKGAGGVAGDAGAAGGIAAEDASSASKIATAANTFLKAAGPLAILATGFATSHPTQSNFPTGTALSLAGADILKGQKSKMSTAQIIKMLEGQGFTQAQIAQAFQSIGQSVPAALATGIKKGSPAASKASQDLAKKVQNSYSVVMKQGSPSQVMEGYGKNDVLGLIQGIQKQQPQAIKATQALGKQMALTLNTGSMEQMFRTAGYNLAISISRGIASGEGALESAIIATVTKAVGATLQKAIDNAISTAMGSALSSTKVKAGSVYR